MDARGIVRVDAALEDALGCTLLAGVLTGSLGGGDFPHPVGRAVLAAAGGVLLVVALALWIVRLPLAWLAAANGVTAVAALVWLLAATGFSPVGEALVAATAAGLACLAVTQLATLRR